MKPRVAFIFTHQIQYFTNLLDELHRRGRMRLHCFYARDTAQMHDHGFNRTISWDNRADASFASSVIEPGWLARRFCPQGTWRGGLFAKLDAFAPQVVHLNGFANAIQWQAWLWARLRGARIVMRGDGDVLRDAGSAGLKTLLSRLMTRLFTSGAERVFYQGDSNLDYWAVRGACGPQLRWVPCVPDSHVFRAAAFSGGAEREAFRTAEGVQSGDCVFLVSGKLELRKRPKDAIEALARMEAKNAHVWFLGSGVLEEELKVHAARLGVGKRVRFWGFQNQTQMPRILQAADVCLHLSQIDPWPYSVLECALSGQALLLSDRTGSYPDLVGAAGGGLTFPCGNLDALAVRMSGLAGDPAKVLSFKEKLRVELDHYTEDVFCGIFEQAVNEMVPA